MSVDSPALRHKLHKWLWLAVLALFILLPAGLFLSFTFRPARTIEKEMDRIRAAGHPASPQELDEFYRGPPPDQDVTELWLSATRPLLAPEYEQAAGWLPSVGTGKSDDVPPPGQDWPQLEEAEKHLARYQASIDQLHEAADRGGAARFPIDFAGDPVTHLPHLANISAGRQLLTLEAHVRSHRGDAAGAARAIDTLFVLGNALEQEPTGPSQLRRMGCHGRARELLQRMLPTLDFAEQDLLRLQSRLRAIRYMPGARRAILGERVGALHEQLQSPLAKGRLLGTTVDPTYFFEVSSRFIAATERPLPQAFFMARDIDREIAQRYEAAGRAATTLYPLTGKKRVWFHLIVTTAARCQAQGATADAAIAIELFRRKIGNLARKLDDLVPQFLPMVPIDPCDGKSIRYVVREGEYVLYSVSIDGIDDGGESQGGHLPDAAFVVPLR
jgi:hypothetical protein